MHLLVNEYQARLPEFDALREAAILHIQRLLQEAGLNIHHVTGRVKKPLSLADKLQRKPGRYQQLSDVTDLVGLRIITYFESDVNVISRLIEDAYKVDWNHSVDKSKVHAPDRFGYMGVHYVVCPGSEIPEFARLSRAGCFEIQIRSILQHAWAEIEHDLGYKNPEAVPREVQRRFYRLAGLLEMADEEFMAVARMSRDYAANLPQRIQDDPDSVFIDLHSVKHLLGLPPLRPLDEQVAEAMNVMLLVNWPDPERAQRLTSLLQYVGVYSVGQLQKELARCERDIVRFAAALKPRLSEAWTPAGGARPGTCLVHYALLRACENPALQASEVLERVDMNGTDSAERVEQTVQAVYREVMAAPGPHPPENFSPAD